jgi:hypothetical protein
MDEEAMEEGVPFYTRGGGGDGRRKNPVKLRHRRCRAQRGEAVASRLRGVRPHHAIMSSGKNRGRREDTEEEGDAVCCLGW